MTFVSKLALTLAFAAAPVLAQASNFKLSSPSIKPGAKLTSAKVFKGFGCEGGNLSPSLSWQGVPQGTKSLAVTVYDPDAPTGSGWWHWQAYNLPASTTALTEGAGGADGRALPAGSAQGRNDYGVAGFGGACPPAGSKPHRYIFTVHALKVERLDLPADASAALVGYMINANRIGQASLQGLYAR